MRISIRYLNVLGSLLIALGGFSSHAMAQIQFSDDFESYNLPDGGIIGGGWTWFLNAYTGLFPTCDAHIFGWGPNPAPNSNGPYAVSNIGVGTTGQALNVFSDYGSDQHPLGNCVETNVFQERVLTASDAGQYTFRFETQVTDTLGAGVQTFGFIKVLDPNLGYAMVGFVSVLTDTGGEKSLTIDLASDDAGKIVQWGFTNVASYYLPSGRFYDNVTFEQEAVEPPPVGPGGPRAEGIPIPLWALFGIAGLLAYVGGKRLRSRRRS